MRLKSLTSRGGSASRAASARRIAFALLALALMPVVASADTLDWLLGLDGSDLSWQDESVTLGWRYALPAWAWVGIVIAAAGLSWMSYARLNAPVVARGFLATLRTLLILWLVVLLCGPKLVRVDERKELDTLVVMVDRSGSMGTRDMEAPGSATTTTRDAALKQALRDQAEVFSAERLGKERRVLWLGFDEGSFEIDGGEALAGQLPDADGTTTRLRTALEQALQLTAGRPVSGIVMLTEGRSPEATPAALLRQLDEQEVRVYPVPLGAVDLPLDLTVESVANPRGVFAGDVAPIIARVEQIGASPGEPGAIDPARVRVKLVDVETGEVLRSVSLEGRRLDEPVRLEARTDPDKPGAVNWQVVVEVDGEDITTDAPAAEPPASPDPSAAPDNTTTADATPATGPADAPTTEAPEQDPEVPVGVSANSPELTLKNNARPVKLDVDDTPMRVLYIDGYPRWEYRYLVSMLKREQSINSSVLLRTAGESFVQEGDTSIRRAPVDEEEIREYDVIIIGDVEPDYLSEQQWALIGRHVAEGKAGLLWIGGSRHTPGAFAQTPLGNLLPMRDPGDVDQLRFDGRKIELEPTAAARVLNVLQLRDPGAAPGRGDPNTAPAQQWPTSLPPLEWAQNMGTLKPAAEPLAVAKNVILPDGNPAPLIVRMRYGAGEVLYVASDDTWRYRRGIGEHYYEQFWIQLVRMLARARVAQGDDPARLEVEPGRMELGSTAVVRLVVEDAELAARVPNRVTVAVTRGSPEDADPEQAIETIELAREPARGTGTVSLVGRWRPTIPGELALTVTDAALADLQLSASAEVVSDDDELRRPAADPERLDAIAAGTGGTVVGLNELTRLEKLVRNLTQITPVTVDQPIWNSWLALIVFMVLLTVEWIVRKLVQLV